ncbi:MAG: hypothetical protein ACXVXT_16725 [Blastococcus sp.]
MAPRRLLVAISTAQLIAGVSGWAVAVRRRRNWDVRQAWAPWAFLHGAPEHVARDSLWSGTAYSAPAYMLAVQLWAIRRLAAGPDDGARRLLGMCGAVMAPGYLGEKYVRAHLRPGGWNPVETPLAATSIGLAAAMAVLGHQAASGR